MSLKPAEKRIDQGINCPVMERSLHLDKAKHSYSITVHKAWQTTYLETDESALRPSKGMLNAPFAPFQYLPLSFICNTL